MIYKVIVVAFEEILIAHRLVLLVYSAVLQALYSSPGGV